MRIYIQVFFFLHSHTVTPVTGVFQAVTAGTHIAQVSENFAPKHTFGATQQIPTSALKGVTFHCVLVSRLRLLSITYNTCVYNYIHLTHIDVSTTINSSNREASDITMANDIAFKCAKYLSK